MSKRLLDIGMEVAGPAPFLAKVGLDPDMTVDELQELLQLGREYKQNYVEGVYAPDVAEGLRKIREMMQK